MKLAAFWRSRSGLKLFHLPHRVTAPRRGTAKGQKKAVDFWEFGSDGDVT